MVDAQQRRTLKEVLLDRTLAVAFFNSLRSARRRCGSSKEPLNLTSSKVESRPSP